MKIARSSVLALLASAALVGYLGARLATSGVYLVDAAAEVKEPDVTSIDLARGDQIVAGAADARGGLWVIVRDGASVPKLAAYHITASEGVATRIGLDLPAVGRLGSAAVDSEGNVWIGAGIQLLNIDARSGRVIKHLNLPSAGSVVARAQHAPDGTVLGLGQIVSLALDSHGTLWVSRYAVPALLQVNTHDLSMRTINLQADTDPDRLVSADDGIWFTTNFGTDDHLGARVGHVDTTGTVHLFAESAASLSVVDDQVYTFGVEWHKLNAVGNIVAVNILPRHPLDLRSTAINSRGQLVARGAGESTLHVVDRSGLEVRSISYGSGSFVSRGRSYATTAPLAFLMSTSQGTMWFAAESGSVVYRAR